MVCGRRHDRLLQRDLAVRIPPFTETWDEEIRSNNPIGFDGYHPPASGDESVRTGVVRTSGGELVVIESRFAAYGGTMGVAAGERIVRAYGRATRRRLPVAALVASGGARVQEGMVALTQMARTVTAVHDHRKAGLMTAAVLQPSVTGGVYASWVSLADVLAGQPGATIGFGGPRVVRQVTGSMPPVDSHTAESAFRNGLLDSLVPAGQHWPWLCEVLLGPGRRLPSAVRVPPADPVPSDAWDAVLQARRISRPSGWDWAAWICDGWVDLHGTDPSVRAGLASIGGLRAVVVAMDRHAYGDAAARQRPAGYRLAQRALGLAARLGLPVLTLIDTPGADPGPQAEAEGVAGEIARTLLAMSDLPVPSVALCVGEGGSGGAMALAHADRLLMLSGAVFSVIAPEAGAAILYRDAAHAPALARSLRLTAGGLYALGAIDGLIEEAAPELARRVRGTIMEALIQARPGEREARLTDLADRSLDGAGLSSSAEER